MGNSLQAPRLPRYLRLPDAVRFPRSVRVPGQTGRMPWRAIVFTVLLVAYVLLTLGVVFHSPILSLDQHLQSLNIRHRYPVWDRPLNDYAMLGQRAPSTLVALPWFLWRAWRQRSARPLVLLGTGLLLLNVSVGAVKLATGRVGPLRTHHAHDVFVGGNIYPSGHVSNTVVLYGLIAWIAVKHRRLLIAGVVFLAASVGMTTIFLDTHWFSDVLGGWLAGALVLVALPTVMPYSERAFDAAWGRTVRLWRALRGRPAPQPVPPPDGTAAEPGAGEIPVAGDDLPAQGNETPVSSSARDQRPAAVA